MRFEEKIILISGAGSGMGAATARGFGSEGAKVRVLDQDAESAHRICVEIGAPAPFIGDVANSSFCQEAVTRVVEEHGRLDVLINAAGIIVRADAVETSDADWRRVLDVNVSGVFFLSKAAARVMRDQRAGAIINFGSIWGDVGAAGVAAYCASKGAVHQLTRAMALDHAKDGIRINAVCPGEVDTPMLASARKEPVTEKLMHEIAATVPVGRLARPEEVARVVMFLASEEASYMTGSLVTVDGGFTAQ